MKSGWNLTLIAMGLLALAGCSKSGTSAGGVSPAAQSYVRATAPGGAISVSDAKQQAKDSGNLDHVVLAGVVGAGDQTPWDEGRAAFIVGEVPGSGLNHDGEDDLMDSPPPPPTDAPLEVGDVDDAADPTASADDHADDNAENDHKGHGHSGHDHDNCPFCQRAVANQPLVIVQFVDNTGKVLAQDSRELFGLQVGQKVVVEGSAKMDSLGNLVVTASGIYLGTK